MKKVLIIILLLIPLIISLTIDISSQIISSTMDITIEEIRLEGKSSVLPETVKINVTEYLESGKGYYVKAVILPDIAKKTGAVGWRSSAPDIAYVVEEEDDNKAATVYFTGEAFGLVKITCYSKKNNNVYDIAEFFVTGEDIYRMTVMQYGEATGKQSYDLGVGAEKLFVREVLPSAAITDKTTVWSSDNAAVATVDQSGVVKGVGNGTATITATVREVRSNGGERTHTSSVTVNVGNNASLVKKNYIVTAADGIDLAAYTTGATLTVTDGDGTLEGTVLSYGGATAGEVTLTATSGTATDTLTVRFTKGANELRMVGYDALKASAWAEKAYAGIGAIEFAFRAEVANEGYAGAAPSISYRSSDDGTLSLDADGRMIAKKAGVVTLTAEAAGFTAFALTVEVMQPIEHFSLALDNDNDARGIEGTVVFGNKFITVEADNTFGFTNTYKLEMAAVEPASAPREFNFTSSNTAYATVDDEGNVTFTDAAAGNEVTIYAYAKYTYGGASVRDSYTFKVVDGVNLGLGAPQTPEQHDDILYWQLRYFLMDAEYFSSGAASFQSCVMHSDIYYPVFGTKYARSDGLEMGCYAIVPFADVYGNGYRLDARDFVNEYDQLVLKYTGEANKALKLQNLTINPAIPPSNDNDWENLKALGGYAIRVIMDETYAEDGDELLLKYVTIQNSFNSVVTQCGKVTADGCLVKNTVSSAFMISAATGLYPDLTIRNCIVSNTLAPAVMVSADFLNRPAEEVGKAGKLTFEGKNYIYNWKRIKDTSLGILPEDAVAGLGGTINKEVSNIFKDVIANEQYDHIKVKAGEKGALRSDDYINLGVVMLGSWYNPRYFEVVCDDNEWDKIHCDISESTNWVLDLVGYEPLILYSSSKDADGNFNTQPTEEYAAASDGEGNPLWLLRLKGEA